MGEEAKVARRTLLQVSAVGACALALGGVVASHAEAHAEEAGAEADACDNQYGFLVGLARCAGCGRCVEACRKRNNLSDDTPDRRKVASFKGGTKRSFFISTSCMHCADPSCLKVCPAGAISKNAQGVVKMRPDLCIGCKYCYQACPYEVPRYNSVSMDKCDCCLGAGIAVGADPFCVRACKFGALHFGPLSELMESTNNSAVPIAHVNNPSCLLLGTEK